MDSGEEHKLFREVQQQLRELREANAALTRRVFALETQLGRGSAPAPVIPPVVETPAPAEKVTYWPPPAARPLPPPLPRPSIETAQAAPTLESKFGLAWVNRIGAITVMLGVAFFFKYAVDNEWIGPAGRVMLGVMAGLAAIAAGDRLWKRNQKVFAQGIQALGSVILYLAFFAAFSFYQLIPQGAALGLMIATTVMTGALALRYDARATLLLGLLGGYATPFLLARGEPNDLFFLCYMLALNAGAMFVARLRNWEGVEAVAVAGTWLIHWSWISNRGATFGRHWGALFTGLNYAVMLMSRSGGVVLAAQIAASIALGFGYSREWGVVQVLLVVLFFAGLAISWHKNLAAGAGAALAAYWMGQAVANLPDREQHLAELMTCYTAVFGATLVWAKLRRALEKWDLLTMAGSGVVYYAASYTVLKHEYEAYLGLFTVTVAASYLALGYLIYRDAAEKRDDTGPLLAAGLALAFLALAVPVQLTGFRITIGWALQAAALVWIAYKLRDVRVLWGSGILTALAVVRLAAQDARLYWPPFEDGQGYVLVFNPRFISFLCVCASLFLSAFWIAKMDAVRREIAGVPYVVANALMIWGLHLEVFAYINSRTDIVAGGSLKTLISSVIFAGYGLLFLGSGFARRSAFPRILGLLLFAVVVVKLYFYDIWLLDRVYRIVAFVALGGLLLAGSYLYSRFREKLSTLVKDIQE